LKSWIAILNRQILFGEALLLILCRSTKDV
jgi:hypothetical protein